MNISLADMKARNLAHAILSGATSSMEVTGYFLNKIEALNKEINAFIFTNREYSLRQAEIIDKQIKSGDIPSPLAGVPVALKDNIQVAGLPATCGSKMLKDYIAVYDSGLTENLKKAGLVIIGKTNLDEFGMGSSNEYSYFGPVKNPHSRLKVAGGSSGGSAAAVAAGMTPLAFGSDTGGSVRLPAAFCGIPALRPSYSRLSRFGLTAFASSFDQIGPFACDVTDLAMLFDIVCSYDKRDATCVDLPAPNCAAALDQGLEGLKVGIPDEYFQPSLDHSVKEAVENVITLLKTQHIEIKKVSLPSTRFSTAVYYIIANAEASSNLARYDGIRFGYRSKKSGSIAELYANSRTEGFGNEVKRRIMLGTFVLSVGFYEAYYQKAIKARMLIINDFDRVFDECDLVLTPTSPTTAFDLGDRLDDPLKMYLSDIYTVAAPLAGIPAISLPCGKDSAGLPIGLQLMGRRFEENIVLRGAYHIERLISHD